VPASPEEVPDGCREDLVELDGEPLAVRVTGRATDARRGLGMITCDGPVTLDDGSHELRSRPGLDTGVDVDRLVFASDAEGTPAAVEPLGTPLARAGATVDVRSSGATSVDVEVATDGEPFWLVLGQSHSEGWHADASSGSLGELQQVDGYANGWLVRPDGAGTMTVELDWRPQRQVWAGMAVSVAVVLLCIGILVATRRPPAVALADTPRVAALLSYAGRRPAPWATTAALTGVVTVGVALASRPWIGVVAGVVTLVGARIAEVRRVVFLGPAIALALSRLTHRPELAWLALALLLADLVCGWLWWPRRQAPPADGSPASTTSADGLSSGTKRRRARLFSARSASPGAATSSSPSASR
jgi:arabinofuranan 3-O-arabinosyltransferase